MTDDIVRRNTKVLMKRDHFRGLPDYPLPTGYGSKWYEPGDEQAWYDIHRKAEKYAEISPGLHDQVFGTDAEVLGTRQCFLLNANHRPIATATAWYEADFLGAPWGRLHWVAVIPRYQGQGLSKPLLTIVLTRMAELGHQHVFLRTSTARIPAIRLYQTFGFHPLIRAAQDRDTWRQLNLALPQPFDL